MTEKSVLALNVGVDWGREGNGPPNLHRPGERKSHRATGAEPDLTLSWIQNFVDVDLDNPPAGDRTALCL